MGSSVCPCVASFHAINASNVAAQIRDVLAQGQLAVDLDVVHHGVLRVLIDHAVGALFEFLGIRLGPPVVQIAMWRRTGRPSSSKPCVSSWPMVAPVSP